MTLLHLAATETIKITAHDIGLPTSTATVGDALANVLKLLITLAGMLAVVFAVVGGLQMTASGGNPQNFKMGRETLVYAIVGLVLAIAAFGIVTFITSNVK